MIGCYKCRVKLDTSLGIGITAREVGQSVCPNWVKPVSKDFRASPPVLSMSLWIIKLNV